MPPKRRPPAPPDGGPKGKRPEGDGNPVEYAKRHKGTTALVVAGAGLAVVLLIRHGSSGAGGGSGGAVDPNATNTPASAGGPATFTGDGGGGFDPGMESLQNTLLAQLLAEQGNKGSPPPAPKPKPKPKPRPAPTPTPKPKRKPRRFPTPKPNPPLRRRSG